MKLYISPGACSMSCHIAFEESGLPFETHLANSENPSSWDPIEKLNPAGAVPVLTLDDGKVLTQNVAILNYISERAPEAHLLPKAGTYEKAQALQWLSWVAADLHPTIGTLFTPDLSVEARDQALKEVDALLTVADRHMEGKTFVAANQFTVADAYLFTVYGWTGFLKVPNEKYRNLNTYAARIAERPAVHTVMKREGLIK